MLTSVVASNPSMKNAVGANQTPWRYVEVGGGGSWPTPMKTQKGGGSLSSTSTEIKKELGAAASFRGTWHRGVHQLSRTCWSWRCQPSWRQREGRQLPWPPQRHLVSGTLEDSGEKNSVSYISHGCLGTSGGSALPGCMEISGWTVDRGTFFNWGRFICFFDWGRAWRGYVGGTDVSDDTGERQDSSGVVAAGGRRRVREHLSLNASINSFNCSVNLSNKSSVSTILTHKSVSTSVPVTSQSHWQSSGASCLVLSRSVYSLDPDADRYKEFE